MAISGLIRTYGQSTANFEDLENMITLLSPTETPLFALLNREPVESTKHEWIEDTLRGMTSSLAATAVSDTDSTEVTVASGDGALKFNVASNYPTLIRVDEEIMLVTSVSTDTLTVTRAYGGSSVAGHASSAVVEILAELELEGADAKTAFSQTRSRPYNYTQIFSATVLISGTQEAVAKAGTDSEVAYQARRRLQELAIQVERSIISGVRQVGSASAYRTMGGLWTFIDTNKTNASGAAISTSAIDTDLKAVYDQGGNPRLLVCNSSQSTNISRLFKDRIRSEPEGVLGGAQIARILNPVAGEGELAIIVDRWVPQHEYYVLDPEMVSLGVLRTFRTKDIGDTGDAEKKEVIGEYTLVPKAERFHARRYGLSTTVSS